jgi:hypothetical protein
MAKDKVQKDKQRSTKHTNKTKDGGSFLCCIVFSFICLRPVFCVSNVARVSGLFILACHFGFIKRLLKSMVMFYIKI